MATEQDTGKFRTNTKDQYYTKTAVAKKCVDLVLSLVPGLETHQWVEPSAGNGVFLKALPAGFDRLGIDLEPKSDGIQRGDFLEWAPISVRPRVFFGNPPFGKQGSLAKSFIKHASLNAQVIAFILPRSFVKPSMSRAFPLKFHLLHSVELEKNAFEVNGDKYDVPCVFQIWTKKATDREIKDPVKEVGFQYVKAGEAFHIAFKRVGGLAGKCYPASLLLENIVFNPQFHYFLRLDDVNVPFIQAIIEKTNQHVFPSNTVGPRSLSKGEANEVLNRIIRQLGPSPGGN